MSFNESFKTALGFKPFGTREAFLPEGQKALKCADSSATSYCLLHFLNMSALPSTPGAREQNTPGIKDLGVGGFQPHNPTNFAFPVFLSDWTLEPAACIRGLLSDWLITHTCFGRASKSGQSQLQEI